jgi:hypothetical protein
VGERVRVERAYCDGFRVSAALFLKDGWVSYKDITQSVMESFGKFQERDGHVSLVRSAAGDDFLGV